jgi:Domain of unknown function (DUF4184)
LIFSALVVGSISPDLHYFVALSSDARPSHTLAGAFYICLPSALAVLWLFHRVLKLPLISLAPAWHQQRLARFATPFKFGPAKRFAFILGSLMTGIFSHIFWDSFTHDYGFMVRHLAILRTRPLLEYGSSRPVYNMLQHLSTVVGTVVLIIAYKRWSKSAAPAPVPATLRLSTRLKSAVITAIASVAALLGIAFAYEESSRFSKFVVNGTISFTSVALLGLIAFSIYWHRASGSGPSTSQPG